MYIIKFILIQDNIHPIMDLVNHLWVLVYMPKDMRKLAKRSKYKKLFLFYSLLFITIGLISKSLINVNPK